MERSVLSANIFRFGLFEADAGRGILMRGGVRVKIQDQPFRVLILLLERPSEIVTREELRQRLWPEGTFVDFDGSLNVILKKLRAAIDENSDNPRFIETVPRRGYRFIAPVTSPGAKQERVPAPEASQRPGPLPSAAPHAADIRTASPILRYASLGIAALIILAALIFWSRYVSPRRIAPSESKAPVAVRKSV